MTVPTAVPSQVIAGDTWAWTLDLADYPAGTWTATAYFQNKDGSFNAVGTQDVLLHSFTVPAATTATYSPGEYTWSLRVTDGSTTATVDSGSLEVLHNPAAEGARDTRSWAKKTLEAVECFLLGNASTAQASMTLKDRSISRWPIADLQQFRKELRAEVNSEASTATDGRGRTIKVRYVRP